MQQNQFKKLIKRKIFHRTAKAENGERLAVEISNSFLTTLYPENLFEQKKSLSETRTMFTNWKLKE